jgi:hypothetical protein
VWRGNLRAGAVSDVQSAGRAGSSSRLAGCYLVVPPPVCEIGLVAFALFVAVCSGVPGGVSVPALLFGLLVLAAVTLAQEVSYCEVAPTLLFACAVLYAVPPLPPLGLLMPGSLWTEPGDVAELPGVSWVGFPLGEACSHVLPWPAGLAYAGAAPITAMVTMQLAENSLCLIFTLRLGARRGAHPSGYTMSRGIWFK